MLRLVDITSGSVTTIAGHAAGGAGRADGVANNAWFTLPYGIALDAAGAIAVVVGFHERTGGMCGARIA